MQFDESEINSWKDEMRAIHSEKRERQFEQQRPNIRTYKQVKAEEQIFNPILQQFNTQDKEKLANSKKHEKISKDLEKQKKSLEKYLRDYNIVNLDKIDGINKKEIEQAKNILVPAVREFNIINNNNLEDLYFKNVKVLKQNKEKLKVFDSSRLRDFNIINNKYGQDHEQKYQNEQNKHNDDLNQKAKDKLNFDIIRGTFYDKSKEEQFQNELKKKQLDHGKDAQFKLPPSMIWRESVIVDPTKEVPESIKRIDEKQKQKKKRYELKYAIEQEYKNRDVEAAELKQQRLVNKIQEGKYIEDLKKGFDIITLENNTDQLQKLQAFTNKKPTLNTWEKIQYTAGLQTLDNKLQTNSEFNQTSKTQNEFLNTNNIQEKHEISNNQQENQQLQNEVQQQINSAQGKQDFKKENKFSLTGTLYQNNRDLNEDALRERYHMPAQTKIKLPRLEQKSQEPSIKVNQQAGYQIKPKNYEQKLELTGQNEPKIIPKWVQPPRRIKTGGFGAGLSDQTQ